ncbi:spore germination protein [Halobacillus litoralis]|uniref:spore germination protein n=1 Tax=Halobacillus litoralis TaxID=45668 RepID=UPI001CFE8B20|nr:spore germination protein [Halobacillus litoralis]WLR47297.1 spore germination protein [Halobacillus litoralis]
MKKLNKDIIEEKMQAEELKIDEMKNFFKDYSNVKFISNEHHSNIVTFYMNGSVDTHQLNQFYHSIVELLSQNKLNTFKGDLPPVEVYHNFKQSIEKVFSGYLMFYKQGDKCIYGVDISKFPQRSLEESNTEVSVKGPRDGFNEDLYTNLLLIRKRLNTENLYTETLTVGEISKTKISIVYLKDKLDNNTLNEVRHRLEDLQVECLISSGQLEQWISDRTFSLFPLFDHIGRPDFAVESLMKGKLIIVIDGSPLVLIGPVKIFELLGSPEDVHFPYHIVFFQRTLRVVALFLSVFLPGFWVAIATVNIDLLPFNLLATVVIARQGMPLPFILEFLFLLLLFEILREAGVRMPKPVGQTITVVGGLIIGDALIRAGMASATLIVVIALSTVATYTIGNQSLIGTFSLLRIYIILISSVLGIYGFMLGMISILLYLSRLESFSVPYLDPVVSLKIKPLLKRKLQQSLKQKNKGFSSRRK